MRDERDMIPFFGCGPHTPDRVAADPAGTDRAARRKARCPTCEGRPRSEDSQFVCMGCHGVAPGLQADLDRLQVEALASREPERNLLARAVTEVAGCRFVLTAAERAELAAEFSDLGRRWLDSIGQSAPTPASAPAPAKPSRRERREAAARAKVVGG